MNTVYRIAKWNEVFETADSRTHKTLRWVSIPVGFNSHGYQAMIDEFGDEAPALYGAWCALVSLAGTLPVRGVLAGSRGQPMSIGAVSRQTGFPIGVFERLFEWAKKPDIGWILTDSVSDQPATSQQPASDQPTTSQRPADNSPVTRLHYPTTTQPNPTLPNTTTTTTGKVVEDVVVDVREAERQANKLARSQRITTQFTTQEIWEIAYAVTAIGNVDFCPSMVEAMKSGTIEKARGYVLASLRKAVAEAGPQYRVADLRKAAGQWEDIKAAMNGVEVS